MAVANTIAYYDLKKFYSTCPRSGIHKISCDEKYYNDYKGKKYFNYEKLTLNV
jgi:hypothetical protein